MDKRYYSYLADMKLKATEYRIVLVLLTKPYTAAQLVKETGIAKGNTSRYIKKLKKLGSIEIDSIQGSNKYYKAVCDMRKLMELMPGQIEL